MLQKLYALVNGDIVSDNQDSVMHQEVLLPGHLYTDLLKDVLQEWLNLTNGMIKKDITSSTLKDASGLHISTNNNRSHS